MAEPGAQTQTAVSRESLGSVGEKCQECGALLASDQRYCLNCGARRGESRVEYSRYMAQAAGGEGRQPLSSTPPSAQAPGPDAEPPAKQQRDYTPLAAVGGIAILGLLLLVGVLIGRGDNDPVSTPPPVIVKGSGEESASSGGSEQDKGNANATKPAGGGKDKGASKGAGGAAPVEASSESLNELNSQSGEDYVEESKKIPDEVVTPGKPPPIDKSKPPGGGEGGGLVIK
jgi:hypothetical protein